MNSISRSLSVGVFAFTAIFSLTRATAEEEAIPPAQREILERFIGNWESEVEHKLAGEVSKTIESRRWSKRGRFVVSEDYNLSTERESHFLIAFDPRDKNFRACYVDTLTSAMMFGTWDDARQTMNWSGTDSYGSSLKGVTKFIDKDHVEWDLVVSDPEGKAVVHMLAKQVRQKAADK